jgi:hypothetical protein
MAPENFLLGTRVAGEAMFARLREIGNPKIASDVREQQAIFLALADLYVLRTSFLHHPVAGFWPSNNAFGGHLR